MKVRTELVILKLGGSVITRKQEGRAEVNTENLSRLSKEISEAQKEEKFLVVVVHGAGPFGHIPAKEYNLNDGFKGSDQIKGFILTHQSMEKLNYFVVEELQKNKVNAVAFQPSAAGLLKSRKLTSFRTDIIKKLLSIGLVPVPYGDVLFDEKIGCAILSGDQLVPYLAEKLKADRIILTADVAGIYDMDPKKNKDAVLLKEITPKTAGKIRKIGTSGGVDVTGGMEGKLSELMRLAKKGVESEIIDGTKPGLLRRALLGEKGLGTIIKG
jgi:isopentenyl phosphate kinase